jgi:hypothetical protein
MSNAERQRRHKSKLAESGLVQVNVWLPAGAVADFQRAAEIVRQNRKLTVARLVNVETGRLVGLKHPKV